jgi:hypothetical protein
VAGEGVDCRLCSELWQEIGTNAEYRGRATLVILPEFGRDPDGSSTNGFFNHRANDPSTRTTWVMCLGRQWSGRRPSRGRFTTATFVRPSLP